jgi:NAD+ synthase (glutamine-hydrolysing)
MRIALAQLNPTVGDLENNAGLVLAAAERARRDAAELLVTPELLVSGYPPKDLLRRQGFVAACDRAVQRLAEALPDGPAVIVGHPTQIGLPDGRVANAASLLAEGRIVQTVHKTLLPNYDVFDERRYFRPADSVRPIEFRGIRLGVHICEDAWWGQPDTFYHTDPTALSDPVALLAEAGVDVLINLSASPFESGKPARRRSILRGHVEKHHVPFLFVNQVGGNDDLVFDGHSQVMNAAGQVVHELAGFREDLQVVELVAESASFRTDAGSVGHDHIPGISEDPWDVTAAPVADPVHDRESNLLDALILGLRDYLRKCGFAGCVLGLSGGIDSALAAYIAAKAVGPENVHALLMPSRYSSDHSVSDAQMLAANLGLDAELIPIDAVHKAYEATAVIGDDLLSQPAGLADQNLQARIRGAMVMVRSNRRGWLPLATGNKSELAVGYCTLYGDMAGGFAVLADVFKRDVYAVSRLINDREGREAIPRHIIDKAPSAELAPGQFDQNELPPYPVLDGILEGLIEREQSVSQLCDRFPREQVEWVAGRLDRNEYKRRQMPPGIKLSMKAFGSGRRMPIAARIGVT